MSGKPQPELTLPAQLGTWSQPAPHPPTCLAPLPADERMHMNMQLRATLEALNARAMVVGHTPQMSGVNCECDGRVWRADAGMSSGVLDASPQVCE